MFLSSQLQSVPRDKGLKLRTTVNPRKLLNFPKEGRAMEKKAWDFPGWPIARTLSFPCKGALVGTLVWALRSHPHAMQPTSFIKIIKLGLK